MNIERRIEKYCSDGVLGLKCDNKAITFWPEQEGPQVVSYLPCGTQRPFIDKSRPGDSTYIALAIAFVESGVLTFDQIELMLAWIEWQRQFMSDEMGAHRRSFIVTDGAGEELQVVGMFRNLWEAEQAIANTQNVYCHGPEITEVLIRDDQFNLFQKLTGQAKPQG